MKTTSVLLASLLASMFFASTASARAVCQSNTTILTADGQGINQNLVAIADSPGTNTCGANANSALIDRQTGAAVVEVVANASTSRCKVVVKKNGRTVHRDVKRASNGRCLAQSRGLQVEYEGRFYAISAFAERTQ